MQQSDRESAANPGFPVREDKELDYQRRHQRYEGHEHPAV
jgi:hypothetical protein